MLPFLGEAFGNANSIHSLGMQAHEAVERAREHIALLIGADDPSQIYFTSGATEANNWVLNAADRIVISPFEHSALREPALHRGASLLDNAGTTLRPRPEAPSESRESTLLGVMAVNNEV